MHVFIDTNIFLSFFHFSKDDLDALETVFGSHQHGAATVHLTQQVRDEFFRNRENKIKDALKRFKEVKFSPQLPTFMKGYEEYERILELTTQLQTLARSVSEKVDADIVGKRLPADQLIVQIIDRAKIIKTTPEIFSQAYMRVTIGNPPGKSNSIGDAINWTILLESVPAREALHVISEDGDFYSSLKEEAVNPFLEEEWKLRKKSPLYVYRTLTAFMKKHFDGVAFTFDQTKFGLIDQLAETKSFAGTHNLIEKLAAFSYFSQKDVERILDAALKNDQFGRIVTDTDVSDFLHRVAVPRLSNLADPEQRSLVEQVITARSDETAR